jgi:hypothetical protein
MVLGIAALATQPQDRLQRSRHNLGRRMSQVATAPAAGFQFEAVISARKHSALSRQRGRKESKKDRQAGTDFCASQWLHTAFFE